MALSKDDPVYYKKKITDLLKQAKENNLEIMIGKGGISFTAKMQLGGISCDETANVDIRKYIEVK